MNEAKAELVTSEVLYTPRELEVGQGEDHHPRMLRCCPYIGHVSCRNTSPLRAKLLFHVSITW
mgnify:CR=1 FL=1